MAGHGGDHRASGHAARSVGGGLGVGHDRVQAEVVVAVREPCRRDQCVAVVVDLDHRREQFAQQERGRRPHAVVGSPARRERGEWRVWVLICLLLPRRRSAASAPRTAPAGVRPRSGAGSRRAHVPRQQHADRKPVNRAHRNRDRGIAGQVERGVVAGHVERLGAVDVRIERAGRRPWGTSAGSASPRCHTPRTPRRRPPATRARGTARPRNSSRRSSARCSCRPGTAP